MRLWRVQMWVKETLEDLLRWFVWHLPKEAVYWCVVRAWANATTGKWSNESATGVTLKDVLDRWPK